MTQAQIFAPGNYRFVPGVFQYSAGVAAEPGYRIERVRLMNVVPLAEGFRLIEKTLKAAGRPLSAFCACELRSPKPFDEASFEVFNKAYVGTLAHWGLFDGKSNPVARSNVCPVINPPEEPGFFAFSYTVPDDTAAPSFVIAGSGEAPEGKGNYKDHIISLGDLSEEGLRSKARWVLGEMENRMQALGFNWSDVSVTQLYSAHNVYSLMSEEIDRRGAMRGGLTWHLNRPPVVDLEYEMDCRGVYFERVLAIK
jgi:hypothetical protein|uniref:2-amino-5-chloromuconate deaminase CnbZ n=1 Tax=Orrella sp. TaxID=1921583 RepID=UPI004047F978